MKMTETKKAPRPKRLEPAAGTTTGMTTGEGVTAVWNLLLKANAEAKLTDEQLTAAMQEEFPGRDYFQPVPRIRSWYNCGRYGLGYDPDERLERDDPRRSIAYGEDGLPVTRSAATKAAKAKAKKLVMIVRRSKRK